MKNFLQIALLLNFAAVLCGAEILTEKLPLSWGSTPKRWRTTVATAAPGEKPGSVKFTYPITFGADGQPVRTSWPRATLSLNQKKHEGDWEKYDQIEFEVYTRFNRSDEEYLPLTLAVGTVKQRSAFSAPLRNLKQNEWVTCSIPLQKLQGLYPAKSVQFHLNAKEYRQGDKLEVTLRNFRLVRMMAWQIQKFRMTAPRIFEGTTTLPVEFTLLGPGEKHDICFEVFTAGGKKVGESVSIQKRGFAYRTAEIGKLKPGHYKLVLFSSDSRRRQEAAFTVIPSPWGK